MKINDKFELRHSVGLDFQFALGKDGGTSKIVSFNGPAALLRTKLEGRDFELQDVVNILLEEYDVDEETAKRDAAAWVQQMRECQFVID